MAKLFLVLLWVWMDRVPDGAHIPKNAIEQSELIVLGTVSVNQPDIMQDDLGTQFGTFDVKVSAIKVRKSCPVPADRLPQPEYYVQNLVYCSTLNYKPQKRFFKGSSVIVCLKSEGYQDGDWGITWRLIDDASVYEASKENLQLLSKYLQD